jgi:hypothetical protein
MLQKYAYTNDRAGRRRGEERAIRAKKNRFLAARGVPQSPDRTRREGQSAGPEGDSSAQTGNGGIR